VSRARRPVRQGVAASAEWAAMVRPSRAHSKCSLRYVERLEGAVSSCWGRAGAAKASRFTPGPGTWPVRWLATHVSAFDPGASPAGQHVARELTDPLLRHASAALFQCKANGKSSVGLPHLQRPREPWITSHPPLTLQGGELVADGRWAA
jgi:hypothetical protein